MRDATLTEIRQAYLRLALRCHPDKNPDDPEATKIFQRIQAAYVALNKVQCDQNRKEIPKLREEEIKTKAHFPMRTPGDRELMGSLFKEVLLRPPDSDTGFHTVFRKLFQEISYWEMKSKENTDNLPPPSFGGSNTTLEDVNKFYDYWTNFSTKMYVQTNDHQDWLLVPNKTPSKHTLKSLQRDRKKFNMDIRCLVKFVKKQNQRLVQE
ncbi:DnaJ subfamily C member 21-like 2 [Homarus americanus]|uniref:DnaJ subfamily C member 21-like 2 n=1 Tax=Homarus americanus TaxID=6706 RepID=A0A8J5TJK9_HOMAM|nr:DnaJ subfamily C member 21-like 2 [Homarus americanus]